VTALWVSPVLINPPWFDAYWGGYGIFDFMRVEPRFATIRRLQRMTLP